MKQLFPVLLTLAAASLGVSEPPGLAYWSASDLKNYAKQLAPKMNPEKVAVEQLGNFGSHSVLMAHREGNGPAASHAGTDFYVVQSGEATLVLGGAVVDAKAKRPGEVWGTSIRGGKKIKVTAGDAVNIPPNTPHQILLEPGGKITYMVVKIP